MIREMPAILLGKRGKLRYFTAEQHNAFSSVWYEYT